MLELAKGLTRKQMLADSPHFCLQWLCSGLSLCQPTCHPRSPLCLEAELLSLPDSCAKIGMHLLVGLRSSGPRFGVAIGHFQLAYTCDAHQLLSCDYGICNVTAPTPNLKVVAAEHKGITGCFNKVPDVLLKCIIATLEHHTHFDQSLS